MSKYLPVSTTVQRLSRALKKAGLIPPSFNKKSEKQFIMAATVLGFHSGEALEQIASELVPYPQAPKQTPSNGRKIMKVV